MKCVKKLLDLFRLSRFLNNDEKKIIFYLIILYSRKPSNMKNKLFERSFRVIWNDYSSDLMNC